MGQCLSRIGQLSVLAKLVATIKRTDIRVGKLVATLKSTDFIVGQGYLYYISPPPPGGGKNMKNHAWGKNEEKEKGEKGEKVKKKGGKGKKRTCFN